MSEETTNIPQDGTVTTPQAQAPALTVADLRNVRAIIDLSSPEVLLEVLNLKL